MNAKRQMRNWKARAAFIADFLGRRSSTRRTVDCLRLLMAPTSPEQSYLIFG